MIAPCSRRVSASLLSDLGHHLLAWGVPVSEVAFYGPVNVASRQIHLYGVPPKNLAFMSQSQLVFLGYL